MANNFNDTVNWATVIGTAFDNATLRPLRPVYIFDQVCKEKEWNLPTKPSKGASISFPVLASWSANTSALDPTTTSITGSQKNVYTRTNVTLGLYGDHATIDTLEMSAETMVDDISDIGFNLTDQAHNSINLIARATMDLNKYANGASGTLSGTYHAYGSAGTASSVGPLKASDIRLMVSKMRGDKVQTFGGLYEAIITPIQYTQLRGDSDNASWTSSKQYVESGALEISNGDVGVFEGCRFTSNTENAGASSGTISAYIIGRDFVGKAIGKELTIAPKKTMVGNHDNLLVMYWHSLTGYGILRRQAGRIIQTSNTTL